MLKYKNQIILSLDEFDHLLNCLDNQKYIHCVNADGLTTDYKTTQKEIQDAIDSFNLKCRELLNS